MGHHLQKSHPLNNGEHFGNNAVQSALTGTPNSLYTIIIHPIGITKSFCLELEKRENTTLTATIWTSGIAILGLMKRFVRLCSFCLVCMEKGFNLRVSCSLSNNRLEFG